MKFSVASFPNYLLVPVFFPLDMFHLPKTLQTPLRAACTLMVLPVDNSLVSLESLLASSFGPSESRLCIHNVFYTLFPTLPTL
jgi:hypothetical protein